MQKSDTSIYPHSLVGEETGLRRRNLLVNKTIIRDLNVWLLFLGTGYL